MTRHPAFDTGIAILTGIGVGNGVTNILGAIATTSQPVSLGYATAATIELTGALIVYSMMYGKQYDRDR